MRKLTQIEKLSVAGGACDNEHTSDDIKDVLNDGLEHVTDGVDSLSDKLHEKVDHHNKKMFTF